MVNLVRHGLNAWGQWRWLCTHRSSPMGGLKTLDGNGYGRSKPLNTFSGLLYVGVALHYGPYIMCSLGVGLYRLVRISVVHIS